MQSLPCGTVTFLFTDIEGSTRLWEQEPERMRVALARHDLLMRKSIEQNRGVVFKTIGDAFCAAFGQATDAVAAAIGAQTEIKSEAWDLSAPILVRMALHVGDAEQRDNDYFGPPLNRVARLLATGFGQQILLSQAATMLVQDELMPPVTVQSLGKHRLKDLLAPEQIWQLCHPELAREFPPLKTLDFLPTNLPQQVASFIGREREIAEVKRLLTATRLLTLTGSGGTGKTRLSLQVGAELLDSYEDGVWLVELAPLTDPALLVQTIASVLAVREEPGRPLIQTLAENLRAKRLLLILDNCEHVLATAANVADTLLRQSNPLQILATSREALNISGEQTFRIPSLSLPDMDDAALPDKLLDYESTRLFVERASAVSTGFRPSAVNATAVALICRRLDGIPLALELAAARVRSLPVEEINHRLDNCFQLLTGGNRSARPRQQTLRALIDWSYDLLNAQEKSLLARLAVFAGGFTLAAAEQVASGESPGSECLEEWEILDLLTALADKSLLVYEGDREGISRYRMLETVRQYATEKLRNSGIEAFVRARHFRYFLDFAERAEPEMLRADQARWIAEVEAEHDNLRGALEFCHQDETLSDLDLRLTGALWRFWFFSSYLSEGRENITAALERRQSHADDGALAKSLVGLGVIAYFQGDLAGAQSACLRSQEHAQRAGDIWTTGVSLIISGVLANFEAKLDAAKHNFEICLALAEQNKDDWLRALALSDLGFVALQEGNYPQAAERCEQSLVLAREVGERWCIFNSLYSLGLIRIVGGEFATARDLFREAMAISRELGHRISVALCMEGLAGAWGAQGDVEQAALLFGAAAAWREKIGAAVPYAFRFGYDRNIGAVRTALGDERFETMWSEGQQMPFDQAIEFALSGEHPAT